MPDGRIMVMGNANIYYFDDSKVYFYYEDEMNSTSATDIKECILLLSIGDMIEILEQKQKLYNIAPPQIKEWVVSISTGHNSQEHYYNSELCDALWEALKSIL